MYIIGAFKYSALNYIVFFFFSKDAPNNFNFEKNLYMKIMFTENLLGSED